MMPILFHSVRPGLAAALALVFSAVLVACGAMSETATDTNTNWLSACDEHAECGSELACLCGACTVACESDAPCLERDQTSQCSPGAACGAHAVCVSSEQPAPDASTSTVSPDDLLCGRPRADYEYIGEGCPVDFDCWSFTDECGCGCLPAECQTGDRQYMATSEEACSTTTFDCLVQQTPFTDACGCGCQYNEVLSPECDLPDRRYVTIGNGSCVGADVVCKPGESGFENECGCGCILAPAPLTPECDLPDRRYLTVGPDSCAGVAFPDGTCQGETFFENECGCGCILAPDEPACDETGRVALEDDLRAEWANVAACTSDEQCEVQYNDMCGAQTATLEFVGCFLPVNHEADQQRLGEIEAALRSCEVFAADCDCVSLPPAACVEGTCRAGNDETLCESTGGTWVPGSCGHYMCGLSPSCDALIPGCDCGPAQRFETSMGCLPDPACGVD